MMPRFYEHRADNEGTRKAGGSGGHLMSWGPIVFSVFPLNVHEYEHSTATDWAEKEIVGTMIYREWVGEEDDTVHLRGRIFPHHKIGGWPQLEAFEQARKGAMAQQLARAGIGGYDLLGWYVCEELHRGHSFIGPDGIGSMVEFEAGFARVPIPGAAGFLSGMLKILT